MLPKENTQVRSDTDTIDLSEAEPEVNIEVNERYDQVQQILARQRRIAAAERGEKPEQKDVEQLPVQKSHTLKTTENTEWTPYDD